MHGFSACLRHKIHGGEFFAEGKHKNRASKINKLRNSMHRLKSDVRELKGLRESSIISICNREGNLTRRQLNPVDFKVI